MYSDLFRVESFNPQNSLPQKPPQFLDVGEEKALHACMQLIQPGGGQGGLVWSRPHPKRKKVEKKRYIENKCHLYTIIYYHLLFKARHHAMIGVQVFFLNQVLYQPSEASSDSFYKRSQLVISQPSINNMAMSPLTSPPGHGSSDVASKGN